MGRTAKNVAAAVLGLTLALASSAQDADAKFVADAIRGHLTVVKMGELAEERGGRPEIREFGRALVLEHGESLRAVSSFAAELGVVPAAWPIAEAAEPYQALAHISGEEFDRRFATQMVSVHARSVADYRRQAELGGNEQVAALARETRPMLERHLQTARRIEQELKPER